MLSILRFHHVMRGPWRSWQRFSAWYYGPQRWRFSLRVEWNHVHLIPVWPFWRWTWAVPWRTHRQPQKADMFFLQLVVLRFDIQVKVLRGDEVERLPAQLLTLAAAYLLWRWLSRIIGSG